MVTPNIYSHLAGVECICARRFQYCVNSPERSNAASFHDQSRPVLQSLPNPSLGERAEYVSMSHDQHVAPGRLILRLSDDGGVPVLTNVSYQAVQALCDVFWAPDTSRRVRLVDIIHIGTVSSGKHGPRYQIRKHSLDEIRQVTCRILSRVQG